jgi:hypothetical protein
MGKSAAQQVSNALQAGHGFGELSAVQLAGQVQCVELVGQLVEIVAGAGDLEEEMAQVRVLVPTDHDVGIVQSKDLAFQPASRRDLSRGGHAAEHLVGSNIETPSDVNGFTLALDWRIGLFCGFQEASPIRDFKGDTPLARGFLRSA